MKTIVAVLSLMCLSGAFLPATAPAAPADAPWHTWGKSENPVSRPSGNPFLVAFANREQMPVKIYWLSPAGERKFYYTVPPGGSRPQQVRRHAVWIVTDESDEPIGYFKFEKPIAEAIIPHS